MNLMSEPNTGIRTRLETGIAHRRYRYWDKFVFIHINKTGGSSVETALDIPFEHKTALEKIQEWGERAWERKFSFTVVRNPWDKVVSHFFYRVDTNQTQLKDRYIGFNDWVIRAYGEKDALYYDKPKMFMPQLDWITDHDGKILVDEIIRFEQLETGFNQVAEKIGKKARLPHIKKTQRGDYREYYSQEAREAVEQHFQKDIEAFGYRF